MVEPIQLRSKIAAQGASGRKIRFYPPARWDDDAPSGPTASWHQTVPILTGGTRYISGPDRAIKA
jgi:hypothetical protein